MESDDNKALVRRSYPEIDAGNIVAMDDLVAADYLDHNCRFRGFRKDGKA
ncbi:hypothetical protein ACS5PJ_17485 [Pseudarthrobacter sp. YS3]